MISGKPSKTPETPQTDSFDSVARNDMYRLAAVEMASAAGSVSLGHFRTKLAVETKADESPVTRADKATEQAIRGIIADKFPADGIYGEEFGQEVGESGGLWIIDPIDGTRSFISGHMLFGMLIARIEQGEVLASVVNLPAVGEIYSAALGGGANLNGAPIHASRQTDLSKATIYLHEGERLFRSAPDVFSRLLDQGVNRRFSYDCAPYGLLASGFVDVVVDCGLEPYDYLPVSLLVEEAGGVMTDWQGNSLKMQSDARVVAAATPELHAEMLRVIRG